MNDIKMQIEHLEKEMTDPSFWVDKIVAQEKVQKLSELKTKLSDIKKIEAGNAIITIFSGAGGIDAEDFASILFDMYLRYSGNKGFRVNILHKNENDHKGIRNITFEVLGKHVYGELKNESGVHRLVRVSPFSAKKLRHTSFAMVEVIPKFEKEVISIPQDEIKVEFAKSSGPGGQNVNKRETAVRVMHIPTGVVANCESGRSQAQNREQALEILRGKLYKLREASMLEKAAGYQVSKTTEAEWGNQIRSYVLHPYKLVKDHRTNIEHKDPDKVFSDGDLDSFIIAENNL